MKIPAVIGVLSLGCCCGDPTSWLQEEREAQPAKPDPGARGGPEGGEVEALVFSASMDQVCSVALLELPGGRERSLGGWSDCPAEVSVPGARGRVMDDRGVLWALADQPPLDDGKVIEPPELPAVPALEYPDSVSVSYWLGDDGVIHASRRWDKGELVLEDPPMYSEEGSDTWALVGGAWVAGHPSGPGLPVVVLGAPPPVSEPTPEEAAALGAAGWEDACGWQLTGGEPRLAWRVGCTELGGYEGPVLVARGGGWSPIPETAEMDYMRVARQGRWLIVGEGSSPDSIFDLSDLRRVATGARYWFWTAGWVPAGREPGRAGYSSGTAK